MKKAERRRKKSKSESNFCLHFLNVGMGIEKLLGRRYFKRKILEITTSNQLVDNLLSWLQWPLLFVYALLLVGKVENLRMNEMNRAKRKTTWSTCALAEWVRRTCFLNAGLNTLIQFYAWPRDKKARESERERQQLSTTKVINEEGSRRSSWVEQQNERSTIVI